jgi:hypothetical protein
MVGLYSAEILTKFGHLFFAHFIHPSSAAYSELDFCLLLLISWSSPAPSPGVSPPHSE